MGDQYLLLSKIMLVCGIIFLLGAIVLMFLSGISKRIYFRIMRRVNTRKEKKLNELRKRQEAKKELEPLPGEEVKPEPKVVVAGTMQNDTVNSDLEYDFDDSELAMFESKASESQVRDNAMTIELRVGDSFESGRTQVVLVPDTPKFVMLQNDIFVKEGEACRK